ncbi:hypothetical protein AAF712_015550 [Marasmius tenuissimus]|uniref:MYND-type domain-containing protein n=1 Tax=Marasmius tenuissimus TaxID=585030 RepID=A0ABR2ZBE3_9AGAR
MDVTSLKVFVAGVLTGYDTDPLKLAILLRTFLHILNPKNIPVRVTPPTDDPEDASEKALVAFKGLSLNPIEETLQSRPDLRELVIESFGGLVKWANYLCKQRMKDPKKASELSKTIHLAFANFYTVEAIRNGIKSSTETGVHAMLFRYWMECPDTDSYRDYYADLFQKISHEITWEQLNTLGDIGKDPEQPVEIPNAIRDRFRALLNENPMPARSISLMVNLMSATMRFPGHYFTNLMLDRNAVGMLTTALCKAIKLIDDESSEKVYKVQLLSVICASIVSLRFQLIRGLGFPYIRQAVRNGFIDAIVTLGQLDMLEKLDKFTKGCLQHIIGHTLVRGLVIGSVVSVTSNALEAAEKKYGEDLKISKSYLAGDWMDLLMASGTRKVLLDILPSEKQTFKPCAWDGCSVSGKMKDLKRCGGCLIASYCSVECQRKHWKNGHKSYCRLKQQEREENEAEGGQMMFSSSDVQFIRNLALADIRTHLCHLEALAAKKFPKTPGSHLVLYLDYTDPEIPLGKCDLKNTVFDYEFTDPCDEDPLRKLQNAELIKMPRGNPEMYTFIEVSFILGEQVTKRNFMTGPNMFGRGQFLQTDDGKIRSGRCPNNEIRGDLLHPENLALLENLMKVFGVT